MVHRLNQASTLIVIGCTNQRIAFIQGNTRRDRLFRDIGTDIIRLSTKIGKKRNEDARQNAPEKKGMINTPSHICTLFYVIHVPVLLSLSLRTAG